MQGEDGYFPQGSGYRSGLLGVPHKAASRRSSQRRVRRASVALALSRLEREHVALLMAICELEGPRRPNDTNPQVLREALLPLLREDLRQTQHALTRAAQGTYGICEECHRPIAARHMELKPAMTRCPSCEARACGRVQD
jgi:RNA polymerase-binding transcription factor DksA